LPKKREFNLKSQLSCICYGSMGCWVFKWGTQN
jgi:hypothetical protein